jgi:hypothetical protein
MQCTPYQFQLSQHQAAASLGPHTLHTSLHITAPHGALIMDTKQSYTPVKPVCFCVTWIRNGCKFTSTFGQPTPQPYLII